MKQDFQNLYEVFCESVKLYSDRPLFGVKRAGDFQWSTYINFSITVDALAGALHNLGVEKGDKVGVISNNSIEWAAICYACYKLGAVYVPMYETQHFEEWLYISNDSEIKVLFAANDVIYHKIFPRMDEFVCLQNMFVIKGDDEDNNYQTLLERGKNSKDILVQVEKKDLAGFIYTSGTTGNPKGVVLTHGNLISNLLAVMQVFDINESDRSLAFLPWAHSFGQTCELHGMVLSGASLALHQEPPTELLNNLARVKPTVLFAVPRIFNKLYDSVQKNVASKPSFIQYVFKKGLEAVDQRKNVAGQGEQPGSGVWYLMAEKMIFSKIRERFGGRLRYCFSGGAALSSEIGKFIDNIGIMVYEGYGLTETSPVSSCNSPGFRKMGSVGKSLPGVRVFIVNPNNLEELPIGEEGEVCIEGPNVMSEYFKLQDITNKALFKSRDESSYLSFRSGDLGKMDPEGYVYITGRVKELYKLENGKYVTPVPLEEKLQLSFYIQQCMIFGANKPYNVCVLVADLESLRDWAKKNGISSQDKEQLLQNSKVKKLFQDEMDNLATVPVFKGYEKPRKFLLVSEEFTPENGLLTATMKMKRRSIEDKYKAKIEELYTE